MIAPRISFRDWAKFLPPVLVIFCAAAVSASYAETSSQRAVRYVVSLANPGDHLVHVTLVLPSGAGKRELQLPVWNALYQVRDFSQYVDWVRAENDAGRALPVRKLDKSRWLVRGAENGAKVEYEMFADDPGPYGAQMNVQHAFFNLAEILMYPVDARSAPMELRFADVPAGWRAATVLTPVPDSEEFSAENYDRLVDSPVELGTFQEEDFDQGGGHYRVVVDADRSDYDIGKIVPMAQKIVAAETAWMNDRPFQTYLFLYHFPRGPGGGGMEHAYCTAIDVSAQVLADDPLALPNVTAHEFFHLWNVKRIRPQSLEPVDYTKENYTRALWFSEGVTNTVEDYTLLQTGMLTDDAYLSRLAGRITALERRPAHLTQSAEESSLDAWLEKYSYYWVPQRSISYYNKGDLLGVLLDLEVREASRGVASLRDVFQWMNENYARKGKFFPDSEGVEQAAETVSHADLGWFFQKYVAGTGEIPWDDFFRTVGLRLVRQVQTTADAGFQVSRRFGGTALVISVDAGGGAERAGLQAGDTILKINGKTAGADLQQRLGEMQIGQTIRLKVQGNGGERNLQWKVGRRDDVEFELKDLENVTPAQKARRAAWLSGQDQPAKGARD
jgi:predicted metalloprotease with PDZ domain